MASSDGKGINIAVENEIAVLDTALRRQLGATIGAIYCCSTCSRLATAHPDENVKGCRLRRLDDNEYMDSIRLQWDELKAANHSVSAAADQATELAVLKRESADLERHFREESDRFEQEKARSEASIEAMRERVRSLDESVGTFTEKIRQTAVTYQSYRSNPSDDRLWSHVHGLLDDLFLFAGAPSAATAANTGSAPPSSQPDRPASVRHHRIVNSPRTSPEVAEINGFGDDSRTRPSTADSFEPVSVPTTPALPVPNPYRPSAFAQPQHPNLPPTSSSSPTSLATSMQTMVKARLDTAALVNFRNIKKVSFLR